ncbi:MAG: hypothetical protein BroJett040_12770 [Oligoflexia bacterium]|nr:MAG: hypothetical protein BroJett040_12770 [Oligoflexia bacterium]
MKKLILLPLLFFSLISCEAFKDRDLKLAAVDTAKQNYTLAVEKEAAEALGKDHTRLQDCVSYFVNHTEFLIENIERGGEVKATVGIEMVALSTQVRKHMLGILSQAQGKTVNSFNFTEALRLMKQQEPKLAENEFHKMKVNLIKTDKGWVGAN